MNPINSALWFIESHLADDLSLESIAARVAVSPLIRSYPCKACVATAMPLCHWPCSCYPNHSLGQVNEGVAQGHPAIPLTLPEYLQLADWTGRAVRADRRGAIDEQVLLTIIALPAHQPACAPTAPLKIRSTQWLSAPLPI